MIIETGERKSRQQMSGDRQACQLFFRAADELWRKTGRQRKECLYAGIAEYAFPGILICATIVHIDTRISGVRKHGEIPNIISKM